VPAIRKLLIANRGEIARRICATARDLGIVTVAVHTGAERDAAHLADADHAIELPGAGAAAYLDIAAVVDAAKRTGADSVHPGYGFLAENADLGYAVLDAGLVWVGPPPDAMRRMADKLEAKRTAREAGVPVLEVSDSEIPGMPAIVKAAAGGGGKGMRIVWSIDTLNEAIDAARREAERSFGDPTVFVEPYITQVRHVEIQLLGDGHWNLVHLGERECSIQRRHQKVVEESPSTAVTPELRARMGDAAIALAKAIGYRNAGTVEFLLSPEGRFYFMEMNTRLQVEHPVTEEVTGIDIVEQQLLDAAGERLTADVPAEPIGHAIEVRLNAEDPSNDYLPETGTIVGWEPALDLVRVESGVERGSVVTTSFDPLIAKFIGTGDTRDDAATRLALALERSTIQGVRTNRDVLVEILRSERFRSGETTTDFLEQVRLRTRRELTVEERELAIASVVVAAEREARASARVLPTLPSGWRNSRMPPQRRIFEVDGEEVTASYVVGAGDGTIDLGDGERGLRPPHADGMLAYVGGAGAAGNVTRVGDGWWVHGPWGDVHVVERSPFPSSDVEEAAGSLVAPMPGSVVSVAVVVGDQVRKGQTLVVLEAMKMEHPIGSPEDGVVTEVRVAAGEQVERGALLVVVDGATG
jgi:propionyl-CoA carboxylase alpha chain